MGCLLHGPCMLLEQLTAEFHKNLITSWESMATNSLSSLTGQTTTPPGGQTEELQPIVRGHDNEFLLVGEFKLLQKKTSYKYQVKLSPTELSFTPWNDTNKDVTESPLVVSLRDVVGVECAKGNRDKDNSCYLSVFAYTRKKQAPTQNTLKLPSRKRTPVTVIFGQKANYQQNERAASLWKTTIMCLIRGQKVTSDMALNHLALPVPRRMLVLINPFSGPGKALQIFQEKVVPLFAEAGIHFNLVVTERAGHAYNLMSDINLSEWYGIVIVSGDGLIYEVINGLMQRPDWSTAIRTPIGVIPGGSGNALSCTLNFQAGESFLEKHVQNATFLLTRHTILPMDLVAIDTCSGRRLFSFLCVTWGYMSDVDIESEKLRVLGNARFTVGALVRLVGLRKYRGRISFLPVGTYQPRQHAKFRRTQSEYYAHHDNDVQTVSMKRATSTINEQVDRSDSEVDTSQSQVDTSQSEVEVGNNQLGQKDTRQKEAGQKEAGGDRNVKFGLNEAADNEAEKAAMTLKEAGENEAAMTLKEAGENETVQNGAGENIVVKNGAANVVNGKTDSVTEASHVINEAGQSATETSQSKTGPSRNGAAPSAIEADQSENIPLRSSSQSLPRVATGTSYMSSDTPQPIVPTPMLSALTDPVPSNWVTIEGEFVSVAVVFQTHLGPDLIFSQNRSLDEGELDLCLIHHGTSRTKLLKAFLDLADGKVKPGGDIEFFRVHAFRIEPLTAKGYMVVDGEVVDYGPIQGQSLKGMARVMGGTRQ